MAPPKRRSISFKLLILLTLVSVALIVLLTAAFMTYHHQKNSRILASELYLTARLIGESNTESLRYEDEKGAKKKLEALALHEKIDQVCIWNEYNELFVSYTKLEQRLPCDTSFDDKLYISSSYKIPYYGSTLGEVLVIANRNKVLQALEGFYLYAALLATVIIVLGVILFFLVRSLIILPLFRLSMVAEEIASTGDYTSTVPEMERNDEVGILARTLNKMLDKIHAHTDKLSKMNNNLEQAVSERTAELKKALEAKDHFIRNMNHEFNTPAHHIAAMILYAKESFTECRDSLDALRPSKANQGKVEAIRQSVADASNHLDKLEFACEREVSLIQNINALSALAEGTMNYHVEAIDLNDSIIEVVSKYQSKYPEKFIFENDQSAICLFDKNKINVVLDHLFANTIAFAPDSHVTVTTKRCDYEDGDGVLRSGIKCSVIDEGIGINESELEDIFECFAESSRTKTQAGGRGFGLAICRGLINAQKGRIWAEVNPGKKGAIFHFTLPTNNNS